MVSRRLYYNKFQETMDKERAKEFILDDMYRSGCTDKIFVSKDLQKLLDINDKNGLIGIYAVVDTESGEKLFEMDYAYDGDPIIMGVFLHKEFFMEQYWNREVVDI